MFRTIVVPLDGSVFAEHAVPLAVELGRHSGATVRLLRVVPPLADYFFLPPLPNDPLDKDLRQLHVSDAREYLESVAQRVKDAGAIVCDVMEEQEGICESICADVVKNKVDLIVMTSHGRGAVARFWLGSIADKLVRTAPVPVLLARPPEHPPAPDLAHPVALKHFLLALGGNTIAERIVEPALAIGKAAGAMYTLVRVVRPAYPKTKDGLTWWEGRTVIIRSDEVQTSTVTPGHLIPGPPGTGLSKVDEENCAKAEDYLRGVAERLRAGGATVQTRVHVAEQPAAAILREASLVGADLIALETHGRGISRLLMGSVADKVVRGSTLPVLVCRLPHQLS